MPLTERPYSYLVDSLLPEYIKADFPIYVEFIKKYFGALEETSGPVEVLYSITKHIDISRCDDEDLAHFIYQYLNSFPGELLEEVNIRLFIANSKTLYSTKGSIDSYKFIFNLLGGSLEIYYPSDDIFHLNISNLSGTHAIHDNTYYAYYVYEITTDLDEDKYSDIVDNLIHSVGTKRFHKREEFDNFLKFQYDEASQFIALM
jgi:hypothetical protein